ncbi:9840_t:CDS:1, partial [Cetraspora pellucida]
MLILYPTNKWNKVSPIAASWSLVSGILFLWRVSVARQVPMSIAYNMPFSLPLGIGSNIIRLTLEDGTKGFKQRWKTLFQVMFGKSPEYTHSIMPEYMHSTMPEHTHPTAKISNSIRKYHRAEELLRFLALFVDLLAMTVGLIRVWGWWLPFDAIGDVMCMANFTCGIIITDWSSATYSNCVLFEPAVGWFLIIVYTAVCVVLLVGLIAMRGYFIWAIGIVGSAILVVLSGLQSV